MLYRKNVVIIIFFLSFLLIMTNKVSASSFVLAPNNPVGDEHNPCSVLASDVVSFGERSMINESGYLLTLFHTKNTEEYFCVANTTNPYNLSESGVYEIPDLRNKYGLRPAIVHTTNHTAKINGKYYMTISSKIPYSAIYMLSTENDNLTGWTNACGAEGTPIISGASYYNSACTFNNIKNRWTCYVDTATSAPIWYSAHMFNSSDGCNFSDLGEVTPLTKTTNGYLLEFITNVANGDSVFELFTSVVNMTAGWNWYPGWLNGTDAANLVMRNQNLFSGITEQPQDAVHFYTDWSATLNPFLLYFLPDQNLTNAATPISGGSVYDFVGVTDVYASSDIITPVSIGGTISESIYALLIIVVVSGALLMTFITEQERRTVALILAGVVVLLLIAALFL